MIGALIARDVRRGLTGAAWLPIAFFLLVAALMPVCDRPRCAALARIGPGVLWIAALTAALLPIERLIEPDRADGMLDQLALHGIAEESVAFAKIVAHWLTFAPAAADRCAFPPRRCWRWTAPRSPGPRSRSRSERRDSPRLRSPIAAVTAGLPRAGSLAGLLLLPLAVPLLIFGAANALLLEAAVSLLLTAGAPFVAGAAIRALGLDQRAKIAVGRSSPRASSRTAISPISTVPPRSPNSLLDQLADRQRRHAHGIDCQHQEAAVPVEQLAAIGEQRREIFLEPPDLAVGSAAELRADRAGFRRSAARAGPRAR